MPQVNKVTTDQVAAIVQEATRGNSNKVEWNMLGLVTAQLLIAGHPWKSSAPTV
jgi:hypothetical protein